MFKHLACAVALLSAASLHVAHAEVSDAYEDAYKRVGAIKSITSYGPDIFGDKVNLYDGSTEFVQQDVALPGNDALPVSIGRRRRTGDYINPASGAFGDWELEIPHIHGVFSSGSGNLGWTPLDKSYKRCSEYTQEPIGGQAPGGGGTSSEAFWHGDFLYIPGKGDQEIIARSSVNTAAPGGNTAAYPLVTHDGYQISCGVNMVGSSGEGFVVVAPDGTTYVFDHMQKWYSPSVSGNGSGFAANRNSAVVTPNVPANPLVETANYWIVPSKVTDRFGNSVTYDWSSSPMTITASDGRKISVYYNSAGKIDHVSDGSRTWAYGYSSSGFLSSVTLPDGAAWSFSVVGLSSPIHYSTPPGCDTSGGLSVSTSSGTMTHPSGAVGTFKLTATKHGRAYIGGTCVVGQPILGNPEYFATWALTSKSITGPGLGTVSWTHVYPTAVGSMSNCTANCGGTKVVTVTDSEGKVVKHTFGTVWEKTDGQLLQVDEGNASGTLRTTAYTYAGWSDGGGQPFPQEVGFSYAPGDHLNAQQLTPQRSKTITQQGATFNWTANSYDSFARPVSVTKSSSLGYSRTESTTYKDFTNLWVIGLPQSVSVVEPSVTTQTSWNAYDSLGRLLTDYKFGFWQHIRTYNADGTLATITDGAGDPHKIGLSNWKRGIPQTISYPTGHSKTAVVNDYGRITSLTDEAGATTGYAYDALGRLKTITYPTGDAVAYNATNVTFAANANPAYGLPAGHWKQTLTTGNLLEENYFDALWRPVISHRKDTSTGKERFVVKSYDVDGHTLFESYPLDTLSSYSGQFAGTNTLRDALSRPYQIQQSSELGTLTTNISYLSGLQTKTTNPRGKATTVSYQAFDEPGDGAPVKVVDPVGTTAIARNVFGETTAITRSGAFNGATVSATRSYVYDSYHRLCKRLDPESGATVMGYDAAGNIAWQAEGQDLPSATECKQGAVAESAKANFGYDARNRLLTTSYGDGTTLGTTRTLTGDGLPTSVAKGTTTWTYAYNNRRLLTDEVLAFSGGGSYPIQHEYNANGDESYLTYPDASRRALGPNAFGEQGQIGTQLTGVTRYANGAVAGYTFGNGLVRQIAMNGRYLPSSITDTNPGVGTVYQVGLTYDANANVATLNDTLATTDTTAGTHSRTMGYDDLDRLTSASSPNEWGSATYDYDPLDNLRTRTRTGQVVWTGYGGANRINGFTVNGASQTLTQDAKGNITQRGNLVMNWDAENRLTSVTGPTSQSYEYDGNGRRALVHNADGSSLVQVYSSKGLLLYSQKLSASGGVMQAIRNSFLDGKPIVEINGSTASYLHTDALGSTVLRTDANRSGTADTAYDPWGDTWTGNEPSTFGYTGHVNDTATGLVQMQQRYYDPMFGGFLSKDPEPVSTADGSNFNRFNYAKNNPYRYTDPDGRVSFCSGGMACEKIDFGGGSSTDTKWNAAAKTGAVLGGIAGGVAAGGCDFLTAGACVGVNPALVTAGVGGGAAVGMLMGSNIEQAWNQLSNLIDKSLNTPTGPMESQYALVATVAGPYPTVRGGVVSLNVGDVWKYGTTVDPNGRYPQAALSNLNLKMVVQTSGTPYQVLAQEKLMLIQHAVTHGNLPPGNKIFK